MRRRKKKTFQSLNKALPAVLARIGLKSKVQVYRAVAEWQTIAGDAVARHASAIKVEEKTLVVAVDSPAWMTQLLFLKEQILQKIAAQIGPGLIEDIRFILKRESFPT